MSRPHLHPTTSLPQLSGSNLATAPLSSLAQPILAKAQKPATRSQSRTSLVTSSTVNNNTTSSRSSLPSRTSSRQPSSSFSTTSRISRRAVLGEANALPPLSEFGELGGKQAVVPQGLPAAPGVKRTIRSMGRTASAAAGISGMGVRVGPAVKAPRSPTKDGGVRGSRPGASMGGRAEQGTERDPFSLNLRTMGSTSAPNGARDGMGAGGNNNKRGFEAEDNVVVAGGISERTSIMSSPAKRPHFAPPAESSTSNGPRPFDLTSPKKNAVPSSMFSPVRSPAPRLHFYQDADPDSIMSEYTGPSSNLLPIPPSSPFRSAPPPRATKQHVAESDSSDDDIDFLSPRKKPRAEGFRFVPASSATTASGSGLRSPPKKKLPSTRTFHSTVPSSLSSVPAPSILSSAGPPATVPSHRPTSGSMQRTSYALPPPRRVPSMQLAPPPTTIDPQLLAHSHLPPLSPELIPVSGLQSKYAGPATTTNWRSGIPRLAQAPIAPELPVEMDVGDSSTAEANTSGMSDDTARRLAKLQSMLSKLAMPRASVGGSSSPAEARASGRGPKVERRRTIGTSAGAYQEEYEVPLSDAPAAKPCASISGPTASTSGGQSNIRTPRRSSVGVLSSSSTAMIAAIAEGEVSAKPKSKVLQGVVAFVDVRTLEGDDAGMIFVDMLKSMGARVTMRPTLTLTHIVYKSGRPGTLHRFRAHPDPKPFLVGISWVVRCAEIGQCVPEDQYLVDGGKEPTFQKRRKSMEPRALASLGSFGGMTATDPALTATIAASIDRARRKSLQFAPKVGSPLAKRAFMILSEADEEP